MIIQRWLAVFFGSLAALIQVAFIASWPPPLGDWSLCLLIITALISAFRLDLAVCAAIGMGVTFDFLQTTPPLVFLTVWIVVALLLHLLFTRVLTNVSFVSFIALNAAGFLVVTGLSALAWLTLDTLGGLGRATGSSPVAMVVSLVLHCLFAALILLVGRLVRDRMARRFYLPRYGR